MVLAVAVRDAQEKPDALGGSYLSTVLEIYYKLKQLGKQYGKK